MGQLPWYRIATTFITEECAVLDVGCGLGKGLEILKQSTIQVTGQDIDPRLARDDVIIAPISGIADKSFDILTCIDVIEHIEDDHQFVRELGRIARSAVFITTPNWTASRCQWPFHIREYTPRQLRELLEPIGRVDFLKGTPSGDRVWHVRHSRAYDWLNAARNRPLSAFITRCLNRTLPHAARIQSHNAALIHVGTATSVKSNA